ncbi:MAG: hypothetical protein IKV94_05365 [Clostridia bacterium]|nr:hypothetical protein [Clostridia bacterium]
MKTNKKAISLIVLVITIIILGILATTVIISLSNTNIIEQGNNAVNQYNVGQLKQAVMLTEAEYMSAHDGTKPNTFELIDILEEKEIITTEQKKELIQNDGKLKIGDQVYEMDKSDILGITQITCISEPKGYRLRHSFRLLKEVEGVEYMEFGNIAIASSKYNVTEGTKDENFTFSGAEKYGFTLSEANSNMDEWVLISKPKENIYRWNYSIVEMTEEVMDRKLMVRAFVKYRKDGIEGIMYSSISEHSCRDNIQ